MRAPQLVIVEADGWLARHLDEIATESRWLVRTTRSVEGARVLTRERRPCVLVVQFDPGADNPAALELISEVHRAQPDVPVIAVSDGKMSDADRTAWTAALFDLGARYALFPPLTRPVLEDVVSGLMAVAVRRATGGAEPAPPPPAEPPKPKPRRRKRAKEDVIDLADEDVHE